MKIAVFSDAHGNLPYTKACLEELQKYEVDTVYYLGDFVGYFPDGAKVIDLFRGISAVCIKGNHEAMLLGETILDREKDKLYGLQFQRQSLEKETIQFLGRLPSHILMMTRNKKVLFVHGKPSNPTFGYLYENSEFSNDLNYDFDVVFMGHTHRPYVKEIGEKLFVNVGSCGLPRDFGDQPSFVIYDSHQNEVKIIRVLVDINDVITLYPNIQSELIECLKRR